MKSFNVRLLKKFGDCCSYTWCHDIIIVVGVVIIIHHQYPPPPPPPPPPPHHHHHHHVEFPGACHSIKSTALKMSFFSISIIHIHQPAFSHSPGAFPAFSVRPLSCHSPQAPSAWYSVLPDAVSSLTFFLSLLLDRWTLLTLHVTFMTMALQA